MFSDLLKQTVLAGLGAVSLTKEAADRLVDELVKRGEITRDEAHQFMERNKFEREQFSHRVHEEFERWRKGTGFATKSDLERIEAEIRELRAMIEEMKGPEVLGD